MVRQAVQEVVKTITELDKTITKISIVTSLSSADLWGAMPTYTAMAQQFGVSIAGVYEVSQLFYQQGLQTNDVMVLTSETLKLAKISGLDYATATNYMTNAIRSFKMEQQDAAHVTDVYAALAASSASSVEELATAMSKTASSMESVGSTFEETSAMISTMVAVTRESATNIGSAMKSIISRYGELKKAVNANEILESDGENFSLNKVDTALQTVGISVHDAQGQFRGFGEVIAELSEIWNTLDSNTQRYIATIMAGNRQQSRFLALVSSGERYQELLNTAETSEDAGTLQQLKDLESLETKAQQAATALQSIYTAAGLENFLKAWNELKRNIFETLARIGNGNLFGLIVKVSQLFISSAMNIKFIFNALTGSLQTSFKTTATSIAENMHKAAAQMKSSFDNAARGVVGDLNAVGEAGAVNAQKISGTVAATGVQTGSIGLKAARNANIAMFAGNMASLIGLGLEDQNASHFLGALGGALSGGGMGFMMGGVPGAVIGAIAGALPDILAWIKSGSYEERLKKAQQEKDESENTYRQKQATANTTKKELAEWKKLKASQYDSVEAKQAYIVSGVCIDIIVTTSPAETPAF